jgi:HEAT repeat protein
MTPREHLELQCERHGRTAVVDACLELLAGSEDLDLVAMVNNHGADKYADGRPHDDTYWFRVWAMRGLLWVWDPKAAAAVQDGLVDEHWRVREMAAKVVARHEIGDALPDVVQAQGDPVPRVAQAAARAVSALHRSRA